MLIEILNWSEYHPRTDYKSTPWIRLDCRLPGSRKIHGLTIPERWLWVTLLCLAGQENKQGKLKIDSNWLSYISQIDVPIVEAALRHMKDMDMIVLSADTICPRSVHDLSTFATNERNERNERNEERGVDKVASDGDAPPLPAPVSHKTRISGLAAIWNAGRGTLPEVRGMSKARQRSALARFKDHPDPEYWREVVAKIAASDFCRGANDRGWRANFDFLVREGTHLKVMEGAYDNKGAAMEAYDWTEICKERPR